MTLTGGFGGRLSWPLPLPWASAPVDTSVAITNAAIICRNFLLIFSLSLLMLVPRKEGERDAPIREAAREVPDDDSARQALFARKV